MLAPGSILLLASLKKAFPNKGEGEQAGQGKVGPLLQYLEQPTHCTRSKNMVLSALEYQPPPQFC